MAKVIIFFLLLVAFLVYKSINFMYTEDYTGGMTVKVT